jgi:hypothetical protein
VANLPSPGATFDLYREQIFNNGSTYAATGTQVMTDDYRTNILPQTPAQPNRTANPNYSTTPIQADWNNKNKGDLNVSEWTTTFPVIPGT